jgi:hypothetical protein
MAVLPRNALWLVITAPPLALGTAEVVRAFTQVIYKHLAIIFFGGRRDTRIQATESFPAPTPSPFLSLSLVKS